MLSKATMRAKTWEIRSLKKRLKLTPATETLLLAVLVGILGGFGAMAFKKLIFGLQGFLWATDHMDPAILLEVAWYKRLMLPAIGGAIVGPLIWFLAREAQGNGVPEVMIAVLTRNSIIRPVVVVVKILASAINISTGGSVGREGPIVQIGAAIGSTLGQWLRLGPAQMKALVGCGVAAGISATFNAPMAGTLFSMELIVSDFGLTSFTPILVSAVSATAITRHFHGDSAEFVLPEFHMVSPWEFGLYVALGLLAGLVGWFFSRSIYKGLDLFERVSVPPWLKPAVGGLAVGIIALWMPHIMGVGYGTLDMLFDGGLGLGMMAGLVLVKIVATAITVGSGGSGGVFAPSLFIGAMLGGSFGEVVNRLMPDLTAPSLVYALVGMAAVNGACTLAPLSAIVVLVELTNQYSLILPLMTAVVMASFVARKLSPESIYTEKLARAGIVAHGGEDMNILRAVKVKHVLRHDEAVILENATFNQLVQLAMEKHRNVIFTLSEDGRYTGVMSFQDLKYILSNPQELQHACHVHDFAQEISPVRLEDSLDAVVDRFADTGFDRLPVVQDDGTLAGSIVMGDVIRRYNQEVANRNMALELGARIASHDEDHTLHIGGDMVVTEMEVPAWMVGRALGDLELRSKHLVSVFVVKEKQGLADTRFITPGADYVLRAGDLLLVGGKEEAISALEKQD
jgi:CIC family chloride channel protein